MILIDPEQTYKLTSEKDKDAPKTVFICRPLTGRDFARVTRTIDNEMAYRVLEAALVKVEEAHDAKGNKVPWRPENLDRIPYAIADDIARQVLELNQFTEDEQKN